MNIWVAATLVILSAWLYRWIGSIEAQREVFYVTQGATAAILFAFAARQATSAAAAMLLAYGAWEELQVAVCGVGSYGIEVPLTSGLCVVQYGVVPYAIIAAAAITYLWSRHARKTRSRHDD